MKKDSFPVELHHSQTPLLKLCNNRGEWIQVGEGGEWGGGGGVGRGGLNVLQTGPFKNAISRRKKIFSSAS